MSTYTRVINRIEPLESHSLEHNAFTSVNPGIVFLVRRVNKWISGLILLDEIFDSLD